jgi:hypothetical protein
VVVVVPVPGFDCFVEQQRRLLLGRAVVAGVLVAP